MSTQVAFIPKMMDISNDTLAGVVIRSTSPVMRNYGRAVLAIRLSKGVDVAYCSTCARATYHSTCGACVACTKRNIRALVK